MKNSRLLKSFALSSGVVIYVALISFLLLNGENLFGHMANYSGPFLILLLLVFSVAIVGVLIFGYPIYLYMEEKKKEAVFTLFSIVSWMFLFILLVMFLFIVI